MTAPIFISFEGVEGNEGIEGIKSSGRSALAKLLHDRMNSKGIPAVFVQEPGSTPLGEHLRSYIKDTKEMTTTAELLLLEAARAELVATVIRPALAQGNCVIADRYTDSTFAHQAFGHDTSHDTIQSLNDIATLGLTPDLTFLIQLDHANAAPRATDTWSENQPPDFYAKVSKGYRQQAKTNPRRISVLDGPITLREASDLVWRTAMENLSRK